MKQITSLSIAIVLGLTASAQTIRIADNNTNAPTGANIYTTLQAAINAAVANDIVYITPSTTSYGDVTVGKRITIKGVGFGIAEIAPRGSTVGTLTIQNSSNGTDNVSGLLLTGFSFNLVQFALGTGGSSFNNIVMDNITGTTVNHNACVTATDNLIIKNSYISNINVGWCSGTTNTLIRSNVVSNTIDVRNSSTAVITNNLVVSGYTYFINTNASSPNIRIEHNIFSGTVSTVFAQVTNAVITNNIFYGTRPNSTGAPYHSNSFSNNLVLDAFTFPPTALGGPANSGVNNIQGTGPLFTNAPVSTTYNATYNYTLQAGSPCIGAATNPLENIGPSGGLYPWTGNLTLKASAIPVITLFGNSGVVPQNQPLKSNIKAKSN